MTIPTFDELPEHVRRRVTEVAANLNVHPRFIPLEPFLDEAAAEIPEIEPGRFEAHAARRDRLKKSRLEALKATARAEMPTEAELSRQAEALGISVAKLRAGYEEQRQAAAAELKELQDGA